MKKSILIIKNAFFYKKRGVVHDKIINFVACKKIRAFFYSHKNHKNTKNVENDVIVILAL